MDSELSRGNARVMPSLFVGHGSPLNAIEDNLWSRAFRALAQQLPRPTAVLAISAHWYVDGTFLTGNDRPRTIHDFSGFPPALSALQYPAPGDVELAQRVVQRLGEGRAALSVDWGLDHGTWSVLRHLLPDATCPVVQLSVDRRLPPEYHLALGRALVPLREEGVLIMGSGNITHNLAQAMRSAAVGDRTTPGWAARFDADVASAAQARRWEHLVQLVTTEDGRRAHPTLDHYLPLLYVVGAARASDLPTFPITGFDYGSLSMRALLLS